MILQKIVNRFSYLVDEGTMGFHDYTTKYEDLDKFISRVTKEAAMLESTNQFSIINITYTNDKTAIIVYRQIEEEN